MFSFQWCLLTYSFNSLFEMLKHEIACVSAPGTDCAELTPSSELHFEVKSLGRFCESMPVVCVIASCMESYPWE